MRPASLFEKLVSAVLCVTLMFVPGVPGGSLTSGIDADGDGYDDDTGEPFFDSDSDFGGVDDGTEVWLDGTDPTQIDDDVVGTDPEEADDTGSGGGSGNGEGESSDGEDEPEEGESDSDPDPETDDTEETDSTTTNDDTTSIPEPNAAQAPEQTAEIFLRKLILTTGGSASGGNATDLNDHLGDSSGTVLDGEGLIVSDQSGLVVWLSDAADFDENMPTTWAGEKLANEEIESVEWRERLSGEIMESRSDLTFAAIVPKPGEPGNGEYPMFTGEATRMEVRLQTSDGQDALEEMSRSFIKRVEEPGDTTGSGSNEVTYSIVTLTIPEGEKESSDSETLMALITEHGAGEESLLPVEIEVSETVVEGQTLLSYEGTQSLENADVLKIARMENFFSLTETRVDERGVSEPAIEPEVFDGDPDRFYVTIPKLDVEGQGKFFVEISTEDENGTVIDAPTKAELKSVADNPGILRTDSQLLVWRDLDDEDELGGTDETDYEDRTHLAYYEEGRKIAVVLKITLPDGTALKETEVPVVAPRQATVNVFQMNHPQVMKQADIKTSIALAERAYSQIGLSLDFVEHYQLDSPLGTIDDTVGMLLMTNPRDGGEWEFTHEWFDFSKAMDLQYNQGDDKFPPVINTFFVRGWGFKGRSEPGLAILEDDIDSLKFPDGFEGDPELPGYQGVPSDLSSAKDSGYMAGIAGRVTLPHELLHIFAHSSHPDQRLGYGPAPNGNLLLSASPSNNRERGLSISYWQMVRCIDFVDDASQHPDRKGWREP